MGTYFRKSVVLLSLQKQALFSVILCSPFNVYFMYCFCLHDHCIGLCSASGVCVLGLLSGSQEEYIPVSSAKVHSIFLSCTVFIPACSITIGTIGSFSFSTAVKICSWSTTCFSNDGVIAEDPVCFYWFTRILLSTVGVLLNYQMSQLRQYRPLKINWTCECLG